MLISTSSVLWLAIAATQAVEGQAPGSNSRLKDFPLLGFGTWGLDRQNASEVVSVALQTGYRHLDCAKIYGNEKEVGKGIEDGLAKSGLDRESIWVTSKLWNDAYALHAEFAAEQMQC